MATAQLSTQMLIKAALALANSPVVTTVIERRGNAESGAIIVRLDLPDGTCRLESRVVGLDGDYCWRDISGDTPLSADAAQQRISRETGFDPDLWVIAVDATLGRNPFHAI